MKILYNRPKGMKLKVMDHRRITMYSQEQESDLKSTEEKHQISPIIENLHFKKRSKLINLSLRLNKNSSLKSHLLQTIEI